MDNPNAPPQDTQDYYSFSLTAGQSATIVAESLNGLDVQITLVDGNGNVLATGVGGSTNVTRKIENFVAPTTGTYYVEITGDPGVQYSLTVTRSANFDIEPHNTPATAQSADRHQRRAGRARSGRQLTVGTSIEGIDFAVAQQTAAACRRTPTRPSAPPTSSRRSTSRSASTTRRPGTILLDEPLSTFFGSGSGGDVYVALRRHRQSLVRHALDSTDAGFFLAVSKDANPLDGFLPTYDLDQRPRRCRHRLSQAGLQQGRHLRLLQQFRQRRRRGHDRLDQQGRRAGRHADLLRVARRSPSSGPCRRPRCTATRPAGSSGSSRPTATIRGGNTMRVTEMTNYFSNTPTFTYTSLPVAPYQAPTDGQPARRHLDHLPQHDDLPRSSTATACW